jgi:RNA polymerase sigma factor (sigma-70 family)
MLAEGTIPSIAAYDESAWSDLVRRYGGLLRATAASFRLTAQEAEDAAQATWLALVQHVEGLRDPERIAGWLHVTMRRACLKVLKQRKRDERFDGLADRSAADLGPGPEEALLRRERSAIVWAAVDQLPPHQRRLLRALFSVDEQSYLEVSHTLDIPLGGVGPTRGRALARLRFALNQTGIELSDICS